MAGSGEDQPFTNEFVLRMLIGYDRDSNLFEVVCPYCNEMCKIKNHARFPQKCKHLTSVNIPHRVAYFHFIKEREEAL
jgi:hypothetical protein